MASNIDDKDLYKGLDVNAIAEQVKQTEGLVTASTNRIATIIKKIIDTSSASVVEEGKLKEEWSKKISRMEQNYQKEYYANLNDEDRKRYESNVQQNRATHKEKLQAELTYNKTVLEALQSKKRKGEAIDQEEYDRLKKEQRERRRAIADDEKAIAESKARESALDTKIANDKKAAAEKAYQNELKYMASTNKQRNKYRLDKLNQEKQDLAEITKAKLADIDKENISDEEKAAKKQQVSNEYHRQEAELDKESWKLSERNEIEENLQQFLVGLGKELESKIDSILDLWASNEAKFNSRLEQTVESNNSLRTIMDDFTDNYAAANAYIKQEDLMKKAIEAVDAGIAYNVEERAFLSTISDSIQSTFNAFDSNLLQIIRLQRADMTASQLGLESALNKFLLSNFQDTSYLTDVYDSVQGTLIDLISTMDRDSATEVMYQIQKWLGSLYSTGASSNLITTIAQGLNYLGTGNIEGLFGNQSTNTLFGLAASYDNIDYAELIRDGLDASDVNRLMTAMVNYLRDISNEQAENILVQGAFNQVFGTSMSDIRALSNFTATNISNITKSKLTYNDAMKVVGTDLSGLDNRVSTITKLANVWDNYLYSSAESMANNPVSLLTYKALNIIEDATGGISLPSWLTFGTGPILNGLKITQILKGAMFGLSMIGNIGNLASSLSGAANGIGIPEFEEYMTGGDFSSGGLTGISGASAYIGSGNADDAEKSGLAGATENLDDAKEITEANKDENSHDFDDWYNNCIEEDKYVRTSDELSHAILQKIYESMTFLSNQERVQLVQIEAIGNDLAAKGIPTKQIGIPVVQVTQATGKDLVPLMVKSTADESVAQIKDMLSDFSNGINVMTVKTNELDKFQVGVQW